MILFSIYFSQVRVGRSFRRAGSGCGWDVTVGSCFSDLITAVDIGLDLMIEAVFHLVDEFASVQTIGDMIGRYFQCGGQLYGASRGDPEDSIAQSGLAITMGKTDDRRYGNTVTSGPGRPILHHISGTVDHSDR